MKVKFGNTWLATGGLEGTSGASWNGSQVNDEAAFFRAAAKSFFPRGSRETKFAFRVSRGFETEADAIEFAALHFGELPQEGTLLLTDEEETFALSLAGAVIEDFKAGDVKGVSLVVEYAFRGGLFTSEDVPDPDHTDEDGNDIMKIATVNLDVDDQEKTVTFVTPFGAAPRSIKLIIEAPGVAPGVAVVGIRDRSATGFTAVFAAAIPDTGYVLLWEASL